MTAVADTPADVATLRETIIDVLWDAYHYRVARTDECLDCARAAGGLCCPDHEADDAAAAEYTRLRERVEAADPVVFEGLLAAALRGTEET